MPWRIRILVLLLGSALVLALYVFVIADQDPSSQSADIAVVVDGVDPENDAGLRVDVLINVPVRSLGGCDDEVEVKAIISGTPSFWKEHASELAGEHRVGIGLRTQYDDDSLRILDWKSYSLPRDLLPLRGDERVPAPTQSGRVELTQRADTQTGTMLHTATITGWGDHWTPLVMEFKAALTSPRTRGSCYVALPAILAVDTPAVADADAAAHDRASVHATDTTRARGAVTFGRVMVRTNGRLLDGEARPAADVVDGNPWVAGLGSIGEEAAVWRCSAGTARARWPAVAAENPRSREVALDPSATENDTCAGLAVVEARGSATFRDAALLIVGGIFSLLFGALIKHGIAGAGALWGRARPAAGADPDES